MVFWSVCDDLFSTCVSDVEAFARAMQGSKGEKKDDDEDMSLD